MLSLFELPETSLGENAGDAPALETGTRAAAPKSEEGFFDFARYDERKAMTNQLQEQKLPG
jgi:hypothetical protein